MKAALLVESLTGNTWKAAELIADDLTQEGWTITGLAKLRQPDLAAIVSDVREGSVVVERREAALAAVELRLIQSDAIAGRRLSKSIAHAEDDDRAQGKNEVNVLDSPATGHLHAPAFFARARLPVGHRHVSDLGRDERVLAVRQVRELIAAVEPGRIEIGP